LQVVGAVYHMAVTAFLDDATHDVALKRYFCIGVDLCQQAANIVTVGLPTCAKPPNPTEFFPFGKAEK